LPFDTSGCDLQNNVYSVHYSDQSYWVSYIYHHVYSIEKFHQICEALSLFCKLATLLCLFQFPFVIAAETDSDRERWLSALQQSSRMWVSLYLI